MSDYQITDRDADILIDVICYGLVHISTQLTESIIKDDSEAIHYWETLLNNTIPILNNINDFRKGTMKNV